MLDVFLDDARSPLEAADRDFHASLLTSSERERWQRFVRERDRDLWLRARSLLRRGLARTLGVAAQSLHFEEGDGRKPRLCDRDGPSFNLTHTQGLAALVVHEGAEVGIDAEPCDREAPLRVADRFFAPPEIAALNALEPTQRNSRFFMLWTLKEAFLKARGSGLRTPLHSFAFGIDTTAGLLTLETQPDLEEDPKGWWCGSFRAGDHHHLGLAIREAKSTEVEPRFKWLAIDGSVVEASLPRVAVSG